MHSLSVFFRFRRLVKHLGIILVPKWECRRAKLIPDLN